MTLVTTAVTSVLAAGVLVAPSAQAVWGNTVSVHGGKVQVCKVPLGGGDLRIKVRLDNRAAKHDHIAMVFRYRGEQQTQVQVRAARGKFSGVKFLRVNRGDVVGAGIAEVTVGGLGDTLNRSSIPRC